MSDWCAHSDGCQECKVIPQECLVRWLSPDSAVMAGSGMEGREYWLGSLVSMWHQLGSISLGLSYLICGVNDLERLGKNEDKLKRKSMDYIVFFFAYFISIKTFNAFVLNAKTEKSTFIYWWWDVYLGGGCLSVHRGIPKQMGLVKEQDTPRKKCHILWLN